ncbi:MAG: hypothetical protein AAGE52_38825 [Myxococcota bacterium]
MGWIALLWALGCAPSEEERAVANVRAELATAQAEVLTSASDCNTVAAAMEQWHTEHQAEVAASNEAWEAISQGTRDDLFEANPAFHDAYSVRLRFTVQCISTPLRWFGER